MAFADLVCSYSFAPSQAVLDTADSQRTPGLSRPQNLKLSAAEETELRAVIKTAATLGIPRTDAINDAASVLADRMTGDDPAAIRNRAEQAVTAISGELCTELSAEGLPSDSVAGVGRGAVAVRAALAMRGVPYSWGGGGPNGPSYGIGHGAQTKGFDCSGLAEYAWTRAGTRVGGDTSAQWNAGTRVPRSQIRPGDLIFFAHNSKNPATIHHVGIAIDSTRMVHAPSTGSTVRVETWAGVPSREQGFIGIVRP
ncbi:NlpC/P60 family protein [Nonomuraea glycinis]|nr:NlpC/P60 family protein [Nonomuraea glycinis]MCA2178436.1 NlpC/P60 family protein [Nonomuraea glycinis]